MCMEGPRERGAEGLAADPADHQEATEGAAACAEAELFDAAERKFAEVIEMNLIWALICNV